IDVGAQVNGMIKRLGEDKSGDRKSITGFVDYGSRVKKEVSKGKGGTILAEIDPALYQATLDKAKADVDQALATVGLAKANLLDMESKLRQTERDWNRVKNLKGTKALSDSDIDTARYAWETADAAVPGGEAAVKQSEAAVKTAQALLKQAQINVDYCTIK